MTDLKTLKQLVKLMVDNDLSELDMEGEGEKVKLRRRNGQPDVQVVAPTQVAPAPVAVQPTVAETAPTDQAVAAETPAGKTIDSPMVGTFYASPSPDAKAFVAAGDKVGPETVVAIVEAMKVFNEIKAEATGTIKRVLIENGQSVEFGTPLFEIE